MKKETSTKLFENRKVRSLWDYEQEKWYISIVDVIEVLTESNRPRKYWDDLKRKLQAEGSELSEKIGQLKMQSSDGKFYKTDVADVEQLFRLIQSVPSPKAEPFKLWLSQLARERLEEIDDPELGIERLMEYYHRKGYSESWINQRLKSIEIRKELTDEWERRGVKKGQEFAMLTDIITQAWSGMNTKQYKQHSGRIAGNTRKEIEAKTGKKIISSMNAKSIKSNQITEIEELQAIPHFTEANNFFG